VRPVTFPRLWSLLLTIPLAASCLGKDTTPFAEVRAQVQAVSNGCELKEQTHENSRTVSCGDFAPPPHAWWWKSHGAYAEERPFIVHALGGPFYVEGDNWLVVTATKADAERVARALGGEAHPEKDFHDERAPR
jgi:hypothetical protein